MSRTRNPVGVPGGVADVGERGEAVATEGGD